jgi:hypothetical protein
VAEPVCLLLLPAPREAEPLLRSPRVVGADPPRVSYRRLSGLPIADAVAAIQARRLLKALEQRGERRIVAVGAFDPLQYPLARALLASAARPELLYDAPAPDDDRARDLHEQALGRRAMGLDDLEAAYDWLAERLQ